MCRGGIVVADGDPKGCAVGGAVAVAMVVVSAGTNQNNAQGPDVRLGSILLAVPNLRSHVLQTQQTKRQIF